MVDRSSPATEALLPCPFCGDNAALIHARSCTGIARYWQVECSECGATSHGSYHLDRDGAAKEWNTRAPSPSSAGSADAAIEAAQKLFDREIYKLDCSLTECEAKGQARYVENLTAQRKVWVGHKIALSRDPAQASAKPVGRQWIIELIRDQFDPAPSHFKLGDNWDDGAEAIADAILAQLPLLRAEGSAVSSTQQEYHPGEGVSLPSPQRCDGAADLEHLDGMLDDRERG